MNLLPNIDINGNLEDVKEVKKETNVRKKRIRKSRNRSENKVEVLGYFEECSKCNKLMERRKHKTITDKQTNKVYYYSEWDLCKSCGHLQHYEKFKVLNPDVEELNQKTEFIRNI
jgi:uncharacterized protein with PIN domain